MTDLINTWQAEWLALHQDMERSETRALVIKLFAVAVLLAGLIVNLPFCLLLGVLAILWLQDGIFKTFASRSEQRLLILEKAIQEQNVQVAPMGFYSNWQASRPGALSLVGQYIKHALRPTVAYPHILLIALLCLVKFI
ncbi:hypothetical protein P2G88_07675 [Aliiglaciecola sp. CAU 1673]|uniref:hypothetical protein n=1 Tax=Aliiglaciecola sp. CAU 1673 TaxID=3032595 RepID=UPI0023DA901E|nr:hypothetical protein [Aliiglaciecola sp. CAU 1673]MDF2178130.1 hypothetical protein [Aliiglaciecola sp. CAU 1673]